MGRLWMIPMPRSMRRVRMPRKATRKATRVLSKATRMLRKVTRMTMLMRPRKMARKTRGLAMMRLRRVNQRANGEAEEDGAEGAGFKAAEADAIAFGEA